MSMMSHALYWIIFEWNFDMEHIDVMFGHDVENKGSMLRLPMLVL